jgi:peroxiredoxin
MPAIQNRFERHRENGLVVLAVNFDESRETVLEFGNELGLTFPLLLDPGGEIQGRFLVRGYPATFFIDEKGVITTEHIGAITEGLLDEYLDGIVDVR